MAALRRQALTALLPVPAGREVALARALSELGPSLAERLRGAETLHFARLLVVPGEENASGGLARSSLLLETTHDGELGAHLAELYVVAGATLERLLAECEGVSPGGGFEAFAAALQRFARTPRAFAATNEGLSVRRIREDARLRDGIRELLSRERPTLGEMRPLEILRTLRRSLGLATASDAVGSGEARAREPEELLPLFARLLPLVGGMLLHEAWERVLGLWHDRTETVDGGAPPGLPAETPRARSPQRAFTHVAVAKAGRFRRRALRRALELLHSVLGSGGAEARLSGVHALSFLLLDDGRLLFSSRQDESLASRLSGLGRAARSFLALVWSSTQGFPRALVRHLLGGTDDERLLEWLRSRELRAGFSYSAYPALSVRDVVVNAELRRLVSAEPTEARARRLLELV